jgi:hypothetical protein
VKTWFVSSPSAPSRDLPTTSVTGASSFQLSRSRNSLATTLQVMLNKRETLS